MSVKVTGNSRLQAELETRFGKKAMEKIVDDALLAGAKVFEKELANNFESFRDTGASVNEIKISEPIPTPSGRSRKIHWKGPDGRYRIIHINEWGSVKNPNPRGKGKVAISLQNGKKEYRKVLKKSIEERL